MTAIELDYTSRPWTWGGWPTRDQSVQSRNEFITADQLEYLIGCLQDIPFLIDDLEIAELKQDQFSNRPTRIGSDESSLPYRDLEAHRELDRIVLASADLVWHKATHGQPSPFQTTRDAAEFLHDNPRLIAQEPEAEGIGYRIARIHDRLIADHGILDRPPDHSYLGHCPDCGHDLHHNGSPHVICDTPGCTWSRPLDQHLADATQLADDLLLSETEAAGILVDGRQITSHRIHNWIIRGRLVGRTQHRWWRGKIEPVNVYRLGDIRRLIGELDGRCYRAR